MKTSSLSSLAKSNHASLSAVLQEPLLIKKARQNEVQFFLQFGGQAGLYFEELTKIYERYPSFRNLFKKAEAVLVAQSQSQEALMSGFYYQGFQFLEWMSDSEKRPSENYLASSAISQALIFITQILNYKKITHYGEAKDLVSHSSGVAGHSQGIMSACLVAQDLSEDDFEKEFLKVVKYFFWQGLRMQKLHPHFDIAESLKREAQENDWGTPTPMAAIAGLTPNALNVYIQEINKFLKPFEELSISLVNGWKRLIVSGSPKGLIILRRTLTKDHFLDQKKTIKSFSFQFEFLNVSGPYHSKLMQEAKLSFEKFDLKNINLGWQAQDLKIPVYATNDGRDLRKSKNLIKDLLEMQYVQAVDWPACIESATLKNNVTHVLDFGPGEMASTLTFLEREGDGVIVIPCAAKKGEDHFYATESSQLKNRPKLWQDYAPEVVKVGQKLHLKNLYTDFTGYPPIFGGGMTPTTVEVDICAAAANAGYNVEWAGGGQVTEEIFYKRFDELKQKLKPGKATIFNALYLDAYLWNLQYPLLTKMQKQGYPVEGLTISAGVPSREKAQEIIKNLLQHNIWCISFKPGSDSQIQAVLDIADDHPEHKIIMQVEGGKAGGHHSWEDLYALLENNYAKIRRRHNVILCAGGGIGLEQQSTDLLLGTWHESKKIMPVDAVILGTRLMACKEAKTSPQIKKLLAKISGTKKWVKRHEFASGMTSGQSQLGADVHYADNKMARVADFVDRLSKQSEDEIQKQKEKLIKLLNETAKPYFGDVSQMTYAEVLERMIELMAPGQMPDHMIHDAPFFDKSYRLRVLDFAKRAMARVSEKNYDFQKTETLLQKPKQFLDKLLKEEPNLNEVLHPEDEDYFLSLCRRPGKPVNFVPVIDKNIKRWFKSDSLWQAHDPRYSADQVLTIPGPEAIKGIQKINEPVAEIFESFQNHAISKIKSQSKNKNYPELGYVGAALQNQKAKPYLEFKNLEANATLITVVKDGCSLDDFANVLGHLGNTWTQAAFLSSFLLEDNSHRKNYLPQIFAPKLGRSIKIQKKNKKIISLSIFETNETSPFAVLKQENQKIVLTLSHKVFQKNNQHLKIQFSYNPQDAKSPLHYKEDEFKKELLSFYKKLWLKEKTLSKDLWQEFLAKVEVTKEVAENFALVTRDQTHNIANNELTPSLAIALFWQPLAEVLLNQKLNINLLKLLHLSNEFEFLNESLVVGESLEAKIRVESLKSEDNSSIVTVVGTLSSKKDVRVKIRSQFLIQETSHQNQTEYEACKHHDFSVTLDAINLRYLKQKKWLKSDENLKVGEVLNFSVVTKEKHQNHKASYEASGIAWVLKNKKTEFKILLKNSDLKKHPLEFFKEEFSLRNNEAVLQQNGFEYEEEFFAPNDMSAYALASKDLNPIHTDERFAALANLPQKNNLSMPIVHGMWTSAASFSIVQKLYKNILSWKAQFMGMVACGEKLRALVQHEANFDGKLVLQVKVYNSNQDIVMQAKAKVEQNQTAYLFTGQGSQAKGMGMRSYQDSEVARKIWDQMDAFCKEELGFSILKIVRDNPKSILVGGKILSHPKGILHLTQFTQVGLTVLAMAQTEELKAKGLFQNDSALFAGHSLGEYAALACFDSLPKEEVLELVYHRGLTMQNYVPRDENGESPFAMVVVRPKAIGWSETDLENAIQTLNKNKNKEAVYVVNYNIEGSQYSVTGHKTLIQKLEALIEKQAEVVGSQKPGCIWVEGVDVPFHSPLLKDGVEAFRKTLQEKVPSVEVSVLENRYIPNLNAKPFCLDKNYIESVYRQTKSPVLKTMLNDFTKMSRKPEELARILLIELLAYQFASPVQWIRTQKCLLQNPKFQVERVIEFGPSPVLANMFKATLTRTESYYLPKVHHFDSEREEVFYQTQVTAEPVLEDSANEVPTQKNDNPVQEVSSPKVSSQAVAIPKDIPYDTSYALKSLLALKLKLRFDEIQDKDTLEALSSGNSAKRNELLTDIGEEFAVVAMDDAHQMALSELAALISSQSSYLKPGKILKKSFDRALREKLSIDQKALMNHLKNERLLPDGLAQRAELFLALAVREGVSNKSGVLSNIALEKRLSDKSESLKWVDQMVDEFGKAFGFDVPYASQMQSQQGAQVSEEALKEFENRFFGSESPFADFAKDLLELCDVPLKHSETLEDLQDKLELLDLYQKSFGNQVEKVIASKFDTNKIVSLQSSWNWGRQRLAKLFWQHLQDNTAFSKSEIWQLKQQLTENSFAICKYFSDVASQNKNEILKKQLLKLADNKKIDKPKYKPDFFIKEPTVAVKEDGEIFYEETPRQKEKSVSDFVQNLQKKAYAKAPKDFFAALNQIQKTGFDLNNKVVLITGASPGSIAFEVLKNSLMAGAKVIATTTSYHEKRLKTYRSVYQDFGAKGSELWVLPFNQGSEDDVQNLVDWCFENHLIPDFVLPFGAVGEIATLTMMNADSGTATLRVLLQGVEWLIGKMAKALKEHLFTKSKSHFVLPLSPNHGVFGGDGAYADSKLGLESLLAKWKSENEDWGRYVSVVGAEIGWVRGTGLMEANNIIAATMEEKNVRTFSTTEMGLLLTSCLHEDVVSLAQKEPFKVHLTGGFEKLPEISELAQISRQKIEEEASLKKSWQKFLQKEKEILEQNVSEDKPTFKKAKPYSAFPDVPKDLKKNSKAKWQANDVIVVVGYGEVSPFGSSLPRFDAECGCLTPEAAIELAWTMGLIHYEDGTGKIKHQGFVDSQTGKPVSDDQVWKIYGKEITDHTGIRFTESSVQGFDPKHVLVLSDITLEKDLKFSVDSYEQAKPYLKNSPETSDYFEDDQGMHWVVLQKGSLIKVPKRIELSRFVAGQIPKGWDATRFGVSQDLVDQIDRNTTFNLVASSNAFLSAGIEPEEIYDFIDPSLVANAQGGGMGGMTALSKMYHDHREDKTRQADALQETLINVGPAWVTQSLLGSYGPMVHPVAACATSLVSMSVGLDLIAQNKADFAIVGGYDDYSEEGVIGFSDMQATCETEEMLKKGFTPKNMSRPNDSRRGGFVEAQGGGTLLVTRLSKALKMGLPIYSVVGFSNSYSDGVQTSIPAPGLGLLAMAKGGKKNSPLGKALTKLSLSADDITVVSKHDTSTAANDPNENHIHSLVQKTLERTDGNPLYVHSQKSKLGHAKGGAGAWQMIAAIQMLHSGKIPGNNNLEDVDSQMQKFENLVFSDQTLNLGKNGVKSVIMTSLGFGHVGAVTLFAHPNTVLKTLSAKDLNDYFEKRKKREEKHKKMYAQVLLGKKKLFEKRSQRPQTNDEIKGLLKNYDF